jgi:hypothetical protein
MIARGRVAINRFTTLKLQSAVWDGLRVFALAAPEGYAAFLAYSCQIFSLTFALPLLLTPAILAVEIPLPWRPTANRCGPTRADPANER